MSQASSSARLCPGMELVIASHNAGKVREINELIAPLGFTAISAATLDLPEPEETGDTFEANAAIKSESACIISGLPSLADDSGMTVEALGGAPGIYSARWAGPEKDFAAAMEKVRSEILRAGAEPEGAKASFVCVLALSVVGEETRFFRGEIEGTLTFPPKGKNGFGYDPIFIPNGSIESFGEMSADAKHAISHRAIAFAAFVDYLRLLA